MGRGRSKASTYVRGTPVLTSGYQADSFFGYGNGGEFDKWKNDLTTYQEQSTAWYTGHHYSEINTPLREGKQLTPNLKARRNAIDGAISKFTLTNDIDVYRGSSATLLGGVTDPAELNKKLKGATLIDLGYMSTSAVKGSNFSGSIEYHIRVKAGKGKGAWVKPISNFSYENEFLIARGTEFKFKKAEKHPTNPSKTIVYLEC